MKLVRVLKWALVLPAVWLAGIAAWTASGMTLLLYPSILKVAADLHIPDHIAVDFVGTCERLVIFSVFALPVSLSIGWALNARVRNQIRWAVTAAVLLMMPVLWESNAPGLWWSRLAALTAAAVVVAGATIASVKHTAAVQWASVAIAFLALTIPTWRAWATTPPSPPIARKVWSTVLQKGTWQAMNTGSTFAATRQVAFAADRIVAIFDAGSNGYIGGQPISTCRLVSIDRSTGEIKSTRQFEGRWGAMPYVFGTPEGRIVVSGSKLELLNADLAPTGVEFELGRGRAIQASADGRVIGWELNPGTALIDTSTLRPVGTRFKESVPTSVSLGSVVTDNVYWYGDYPKDKSFITLDDGTAQRLLFHGDCGSRPQFLSDTLLLSIGCGDLRLINTSGTVIKQRKIDCCYANYAGVSRDGSRFALDFHDERGDPPMLLYERFLIYDGRSLRPVASVVPGSMPERQSWSAFSPNGKFFTAGNPDSLTLFELPPTSD